MSNLNTYHQKIKAVEALIDKLAKGELAKEELIELEQLTRALHERSVILKYKAFEDQSTESTATAPVEEAPVEQVEATIEEETPEPSGIDFSMFGSEVEETVEEPEEETEPVMVAPVMEAPVVEEPVVEIAEETHEDEEEEVLAEEPAPAPSGSFLDRLNIADNSLSAQFSGAKLDTLIGAFGLNERLQYINELFDGSSELFSDAIKLLDSQSDLGAAQKEAEKLAHAHEWDPEEETVVEFMTFLRRRYA